ncbi:MAG TPA: PEGA domain-containing protein [Vicinamibacterales bacterium]|nr:PEGA domain-containing protein [Vicinamibacterales bacterium]
MNTFRLTVTGAALGLLCAAGLPAFAEAPPHQVARQEPGLMRAGGSFMPAAARAYSGARQAVPRAEAAPPPRSAPPPREQAVPRNPAEPAPATAVERRYPGDNNSGMAVRRVDDDEEGGDGAVIVGLGDGGFYGNPFWADDGWGPGLGWGGFGPYGYSSYYGYHGAPEQGGIHIKVKPKTASVFVDGYYVGVVNDFNGFFQKLKLQPGPHRIEIREQGFKPITFNVKTEPGQTITYKGSLQKLP